LARYFFFFLLKLHLECEDLLIDFIVNDLLYFLNLCLSINDFPVLLLIDHLCFVLIFFFESLLFVFKVGDEGHGFEFFPYIRNRLLLFLNLLGELIVGRRFLRSQLMNH
jgi:hypothetical protein